MIRINYWLAIAVLLFSQSLTPAIAIEQADESVKVTLSGQLETSIHRFGEAPRRILWISSTETQTVDFSLAKQLAAADLEIWLTPLQGTSKTSQTPKELSSAQLAELIQESLPSKTENKLYIFSTGEQAKAAVESLKTWQDARGSSKQLAGLILAYPELTLGKTKQADPQFIEAAYQLKLPIYLFQPTKKLNLTALEGLVAAFEKAGSIVYAEVVNDVAAGYLQREASSEEEALQASVFPAQFTQALDKLGEAASQLSVAKTETTDEQTLQEHPTKEIAPELRLTDLNGKMQDLKDYRGKIVLLNFWATWCPPCIKEIPSLNNLQTRFSQKEFVVLSVDVGEEPKDIQAFLEHLPADYPVLVDSTSSSTEPWQLKAFPSTYVIDRKGQLRYMYFGGLEWDEPEIIKFLEKNLEVVAK
ncbi:TlpA disulfide reductase family protein [uncultured Thiothrix sp.]|uniref:TlpA family protein disulfide reductase n=1 Tax=uncultured Thiothrix sp. TaxID=223185 RepID=UPI0026079121|nr:TlpA disulfide reductase family protein [uncultured Thiothrix sp.]HMT92791.1 TlpA disulfide reductase family protein [Thiolinea sp.]